MPTLEKYRLDLNARKPPYHNAAGERIVGTTTVCGVLAKPELIDWAARMEREGLLRLLRASWPPDSVAAFLEMVPEARFHTTARDRSADVGKIIHARIHAHLKGTEIDEDYLREQGVSPEDMDKSVNGWIRWHDWFTAERFECVASELSIVDEGLQVGGQLDLLANSPYGLTLCDYKSSGPNPKSWPYDEHVAQIANYRRMYEAKIIGARDRNHIARTCIYRSGTNESDPGECTWLNVSQISAGEQLFTAALAVYRAKLVLGRVR